MAVCDSAREQPASAIAARAANAANEVIGFTRFMQENSTVEPATKIKRAGHLRVDAGIMSR